SGTKGVREVTVIPEYSVDYAGRVAANDSPENSTWIPFTFTQVITQSHEQKHSGTYHFTWESSGYISLSDSELNSIIKNHKDEWVFQSGEDCRDVEGSTFKFFYYESWTNVSCGYGDCTYDITITCSYIESWETTEVEEGNTFRFNKKTQLRFEAHKDFTFADRFTQSGSDYVHSKYPITVRLRCTTPAVTSGSEVSDCYVEYVHSYCYDVAKSKAAGELIDERILGEREAAKSTLIGVHIKATASNEEKLGKISVVTNGIAPVCQYNEATHSYEWDLVNKKPTSNPASWLLEVLTSPTHAASRVSTEEIDLASFADLYRYCEENLLSVNLVLTKEQKKADILDSILSVCHASLYQNLYGKCAVAIDCVKENAIAVLNEQNLISFSWEKQISLDVDGVRVTYIDEDSGWQENSFVRLYDPEAEIDEDTIIRDISLSGITNFTQAQRQAHYVMSCDKLRPTKARAVVGREGLYFAPYEKVLVQHPSLKAGLGNAVIKSVVVNFNDEIIALDLYDAVDISSEESYSMVIQCVSDSYCTPLSLEIDSQRSAMAEKILYLETPLPMSSAVIPHAGDILSYGYRGNITTITREFLIMAIEPNGSEGYALTLTEYNPAIYDCDASTIPEYNPVITQPKTFTNELPKEVPELTASMYQDFKFAVGNFGLSDTEARALDWFDAPPVVPEGKCLYMATKWIKT
ncbi:MAG: hypothetical protein IJR39_10990, partial [Treponema sp.]|nr:hypothetical protein [Treponema sp.]